MIKQILTFVMLIVTTTTTTIVIGTLGTGHAYMNMSAKPFDPFAKENNNNFTDTQKAILNQLNALAAGNNTKVPVTIMSSDSNNISSITPTNNTTVAKPSTNITPNNTNVVEGLSKTIEGDTSTTTTPLTITGLNQYTKLGVFHILGDLVNKDTNGTAYSDIYLKITIKDKNGMMIGVKQTPMLIQRLVPNTPESFDITLNDNDIGNDVFHIDGYSLHIYGQKINK